MPDHLQEESFEGHLHMTVAYHHLLYSLHAVDGGNIGLLPTTALHGHGFLTLVVQYISLSVFLG